MKHFEIKDKKTIKLMKRHRMKKGHVPMSTMIWQRIYQELGMPASGTPWVVMGNCTEGYTYVVEGLSGPSDVLHMAVEDIAKLPGALQEIIFEIRDGGVEFNNYRSVRGGFMMPDGTIMLSDDLK